MMKRKTFFIFSLFVLLLATSACSQKNAIKINNNEQENQNSTSTDSRNNWQANLDTLSAADLQVGKIVSVMAKQATDGNLTAQNIMLANSYDILEQFQMGLVNFNNSSSTTAQQMPREDEANRPARPDFGALSEEDRARFEEMRAQNGADGAREMPARNFAVGMQNFMGEILSIDSVSLTLKLKDGGSKIIFLSADTKIFSTPTSTAE